MLAALYASVIFGNAFLLFLVQPLIGKAILPWFGGSAAVWTICMLFFQAVLLGGYGLAHLVTQRAPLRLQGAIQLALIAMSLATLPITPDPASKPVGDAEPVLAILHLLTASVGLPYLVLATTSPLLQRWFASDLPDRSPYRLFALSNFASLLALIGYPLLLEPQLGLLGQQVSWSWSYAAVAVPFALLALRRLRRGGLARGSADGPVPATDNAMVIAWVGLAAAASILLLAVTGQLTQNVAPVPLLWLAPLTLYLLSFILCFESERWYRRRVFVAALPPALLGTAMLPLADLESLPIAAIVAAYLLGAFIIFMACHGELARLRPVPAALTRYYLWISFGGALGGLAVGVAAPRLLDSDHDLAIAIFVAAAAVLLAQVAGRRAPVSMRAKLAGAAALLVLGALLVWQRGVETEYALLSVRNFYGTLRIGEEDDTGEPDEKRQLFHGRIMHGEQYLAADKRGLATSYYTDDSGVGRAIDATRAAGRTQRVGVIGLGAGVLASHGRAGDVYRFYEINALVVELARTQFSFLADTKATTEIALGDARLVLEREPPRHFDVLAVDAFTGDAIPIHLLTEEAIELYLRHLATGGVLCVHVSNKYLDLAPLVRLAAERLGWTALLVDDDGGDDEDAAGSTWVVVARHRADLARGRLVDATEEIEIPPGLRPWRDDYSSLFSVLRAPTRDAE